MRDARTYQIRRAILTALKDSDPAPASLDDIICHPTVDMLHASRGELSEELKALTIEEFVRTVKETNGEYRAITKSGLRQINQEADRDVFVWGKYGL